jgi:hypothetical protein
MKLLNKKISRISKFLLLYSLTVGGAWAQKLISSDRFLVKILDRTISYQDITFHERNLQALDCIYPDSLTVGYLEKPFLKDLEHFIQKFPKEEDLVKTYLHGNEAILKKIRYYFKMLRYSEDQNAKVTKDLAELIREATKENKCDTNVLYKDTLKTNFIGLLRLELYLRTRYGSQLKASKRGFEAVRPSMDLFLDSLDKQFGHEYFW